MHLYKRCHEQGVVGADAQVTAPGSSVQWVEVIRHACHCCVLHPVSCSTCLLHNSSIMYMGIGGSLHAVQS